MWARRVFFNKTSGKTLRMWVANGFFKLLTQEEEAAICGLENWACMEWLVPNLSTEAAFAETGENGEARRVEVSVDVSGEEPQLVFTYTTIEDAPAGDNPYQIIDILTGGDA